MRLSFDPAAAENCMTVLLVFLIAEILGGTATPVVLLACEGRAPSGCTIPTLDGHGRFSRMEVDEARCTLLPRTGIEDAIDAEQITVFGRENLPDLH